MWSSFKLTELKIHKTFIVLKGMHDISMHLRVLEIDPLCRLNVISDSC